MNVSVAAAPLGPFQPDETVLCLAEPQASLKEITMRRGMIF
jgi:hypothetical protein